jgi:hypothetical protein
MHIRDFLKRLSEKGFIKQKYRGKYHFFKDGISYCLYLHYDTVWWTFNWGIAVGESKEFRIRTLDEIYIELVNED